MRFLIALVVLMGLSSLAIWYAFTVPETPQLVSIDTQNKQQASNYDKVCYDAEKANEETQAIDVDGRLGLLVWNIYKQNEANWQTALDAYAKDAQLMMLQEASLSDEFKAWIGKQSWGASYVSAFEVFDVGAGVLNLATSLPVEACAYTALEPWILLPKSGLYARYKLSNGQSLAVINIHAINFTIGTNEYKKQIQELEEAISTHQGPVIMAGDFNTWSDKRTQELLGLTQRLGLNEVNFTPDDRRLFVNGLPLDHVFYRGLKLVEAKSIATDASDHNPMQVSFELEANES